MNQIFIYIHLQSEASVSDLNRELDNARSRERGLPGQPAGGNVTDTLRDLLFKLPGGTGGDMTREMEGVERIRAGPSQGGKRPEDMSPQELHAVLWQVLSFRDSVVKKISMTIEKIPGLGPLVEKLMDSISGESQATVQIGCSIVLMRIKCSFCVHNSRALFEAHHEDRYSGTLQCIR